MLFAQRQISVASRREHSFRREFTPRLRQKLFADKAVLKTLILDND